MGKANRVKIELRDASEMVDLIQTLKDIADNKFFTLMSQKDKFRRFGETFVEFFRMVSMTEAEHPLISNDYPAVAIVVVTVEGSFLGEFNNKISRLAVKEAEKHDNVKFVAVGDKSADFIRKLDPDFKLFSNVETRGFYESAVEVKDYLFDEVMNKRIGKVIVCYSWPKSFETQKTRAVKLLPCEELIHKQAQFVDTFEKVIEESDPFEVIGYLSNLWITTRLYEIFTDTFIASAAAQSSFLEDSVDKMKKEKNKTAMRFRKAKKGDIDKSLRETFSARMIQTQ